MPFFFVTSGMGGPDATGTPGGESVEMRGEILFP